MLSHKHFFVLPALLIALASFNCAATDLYRISASLSHNGKPFAAPTTVVRNASPATIEVSGPSGYKLSLTVTDMAPEKIKVATAIESEYGNFAPTVIVRPGQPATVSAGELDLTITVDRTDS